MDLVFVRKQKTFSKESGIRVSEVFDSSCAQKRVWGAFPANLVKIAFRAVLENSRIGTSDTLVGRQRGTGTSTGNGNS